MMKFSRILLFATCAISFILPAVCFARIGETRSECEKRYGKPTQVEGDCNVYTTEQLTFRVKFGGDGRVEEIVYMKKTSGLTGLMDPSSSYMNIDMIDRLLQNNGFDGKIRWGDDAFTEPVCDKIQWGKSQRTMLGGLWIKGLLPNKFAFEVVELLSFNDGMKAKALSIKSIKTSVTEIEKEKQRKKNELDGLEAPLGGSAQKQSNNKNSNVPPVASKTTEKGQQGSVLPIPDKSYVPDIQLRDLSDKMAKAVDPNGIYQKSNSCFIKQNFMLNGKAFTVETTYKKPNKSKSITYMDGKIINKTVSDGKKCWTTDWNNKTSEILGKNLEHRKFSDEMASTSEPIIDFFDRVEFNGEAKVYESQCYILSCYPKVKDLEPVFLYVSKADYLVKKIILTQVNGKPLVVGIRKYALLKGVMIASEIEMDINNDGKMLLMTVDDYDINMYVPNSDYEQ